MSLAKWKKASSGNCFPYSFLEDIIFFHHLQSTICRQQYSFLGTICVVAHSQRLSVIMKHWQPLSWNDESPLVWYYNQILKNSSVLCNIYPNPWSLGKRSKNTVRKVFHILFSCLWGISSVSQRLPHSSYVCQ